MAVKIDKGIEMETYGNILGDGQYPWAGLEIGDSFECLSPKKASAYNLAKAASGRLHPRKFKAVVRKDALPRIWRIK